VRAKQEEKNNNNITMKIYICLETILKNLRMIPKIKEMYNNGNNITIACTADYRAQHKPKDIEELLKPLENHYHTLSFLKPEYDMIIDYRSKETL